MSDDAYLLAIISQQLEAIFDQLPMSALVQDDRRHRSVTTRERAHPWNPSEDRMYLDYQDRLVGMGDAGADAHTVFTTDHDESSR